MKKFIIFLVLGSLIELKVYSQNDVELTVTAYGTDAENSKNNALRNAIEQAYGAFLSSNTLIKNDELVKDEIISLSNGNVKKFDILSQFKMPDNNWSTSLKCVVSVNKLDSYCKSKGMETTFNGNLFAFNISQKDLFKRNQEKILAELYLLAEKLTPFMFDYEIEAFDPLKYSYGHSKRTIVYDNATNTSKPKEQEDKYVLPVKVTCKVNSNYSNFYKTFVSTLKSISIKESAIAEYKSSNIDLFPALISSSDKTTFIKSFLFQSSVNNVNLGSVEKNIINMMAKEDCDDYKTLNYIFPHGKEFEFVMDNYFSTKLYEQKVYYFATKEIYKLIYKLDNLLVENVLTNYVIKNDQKVLEIDSYEKACLGFGAYIIDLIKKTNDDCYYPPNNLVNAGSFGCFLVRNWWTGVDQDAWRELLKTDHNNSCFNFYNLKEGSLVGITYIGYYFPLNDIKNISKLTITPKH